jgi:hypothetical protein
MRILVGLLAILPVALAAQAPSAVYKCRGNGGLPIYQDSRCPEGRELRDFAADPPPVSVIPFARPPETTPAPGQRPSRGAGKQSPKGTRNTNPAVDPAERRHVKEGMSEGEVRAKLGVPDMRSGKRWTYLPDPGDQQTVTIVRFDDGKVRSVERRVVR